MTNNRFSLDAIANEIVWKCPEKSKSTQENTQSSYRKLADLKIIDDEDHFLSLAELTGIALGLHRGRSLSRKKARKILHYHGVLVTRNWQLFIAHLNPQLERLLKSENPKVLCLEWFFRRQLNLVPSKSPRKINGNSKRGFLIDVEKIIALE